MGHFLKPCPCDTLPISNDRQAAKPRPCPMNESGDRCHMPQRPMIQLQRENDELTITMRPLKNSLALKSEPDPYLACDPIRLKVSGMKEAQQLNKIKKILAEKQFTRCCCGHSVAECRCRDNREMEAVRKCLGELEKKFGVKDLEKKNLFGPPNDNLQLDFTPPAGIIKPQISEQRPCEMNTMETQYNEQDFKENKKGDKKGGDAASKKSGNDDDSSKGKKKGNQNRYIDTSTQMLHY